MPTPNSPGHASVDIHADPAFRGQFENPGGERAFEKANVRDVVEPARNRPRNVGRAEQQIRLVTGGALLGAAAFAPVGPGYRFALAAIGAIEVITGATRYCPLWHSLNINTERGRSSP